MLSVFFSLGCMQHGQVRPHSSHVAKAEDYSASASFPRAHGALDDLEQYGFVYKRGLHPDRFYPTHLATSLCSGDAIVSTSQSADDKRFIILETNYKIYAYTGE